MWLSLELAGQMAGASEPEPLDELVPKIAPRGIMLIATGTGVEPEINRIYQDAAGDSATLWEIPESHHTKGLKTVPDEYERRVVEFFNAELLGQ
jgi:hypothetical protein